MSSIFRGITFSTLSDRGIPHNETGDLQEALQLLMSDIIMIDPNDMLKERLPMNLN